MSKLKQWFILLLVTALFYGSSVKYGFSQDDFFHLTISHTATVKDFFSFFIPHPSLWVFYRPVSTQFWYWLFSSLFGWQNAPLPMHLTALLLHATNAYLVALLLERVFKIKSRFSLLAGALYAASSVHFLSLFYLGATQQLLMTFFGLLAIHANLNNQKIKEIVFFILSLLSKELGLRLLPIVVLIRLIKGESLKNSLKKSASFIAISLIYLAIRYLSGITTPPEYHFDLSPLTTIASLMWYALMSLGAPEKILSYGLSGGRVDFLRYVHDFPILGIINLSAISILSISLLFRKWAPRHFLYGLLWLAGLFPVLFLPTHRYAHYLDLSLVPVLALLLAKNKKDLFLYLSCLAFLAAATSGQLIDRATHWTIQRALVAQQYENVLPKVGACQAKALSFIGSGNKPQELSYALMNENGPRIICQNPALQVYYLPAGALAKEGSETTIAKDTLVINLDR